MMATDRVYELFTSQLLEQNEKPCTALNPQSLEWRVRILTASLFQYLNLLCLVEKLEFYDKLEGSIMIVCFFVSLLPWLFCCLNWLTFIMVPLYYYVSKLFSIAWIFIIVNLYTEAENHGGVARAFIPDPVIVRRIRDGYIVVVLLFICSSLVQHILTKGSWEGIDVNLVISSMGRLCTSGVGWFAVGACLSIFSSLLQAACRAFLFWNINMDIFVTAYYADIGRVAGFEFIMNSIQSGLVYASDDDQTEKLKIVLLLSFYLFIIQIWDITEPYLHYIVNTGEAVSRWKYFRCILLTFFLALLPTVLTLYSAEGLNQGVWMMLNVTGCLLVLFRIPLTLLENTLVAVKFRIEESTVDDRLETIIYIVRVCKALSTAVAVLLMSLYRFNAPFFSSSWIIRAICLFNVVIHVSVNVIYKEWLTYRKRQENVRRVSSLTDASQEQIRDYGDVCAICLVDLDQGKILRCNHIFHTECIRLCLQTRTSCPKCNQEIMELTNNAADNQPNAHLNQGRLNQGHLNQGHLIGAEQNDQQNNELHWENEQDVDLPVGGHNLRQRLV